MSRKKVIRSYCFDEEVALALTAKADAESVSASALLNELLSRILYNEVEEARLLIQKRDNEQIAGYKDAGF